MQYVFSSMLAIKTIQCIHLLEPK